MRRPLRQSAASRRVEAVAFIVLADGEPILTKTLSYDGNQITPDNGALKCHSEGTKILTLYANGGSSTTWADARLYCDEEAQEDLARVTARTEETWMQVGETSAINVTGYIGRVGWGGLQNIKADLTNATITYSSSDESVARVENGAIVQWLTVLRRSPAMWNWTA
ncbi:MAG: hypothetical protein ACLS8R_06420 [Anaeromassilibacillus sp.]